MKYMLLVGIVLGVMPIVYANVVISEVYYDPIGTESGGEAVELYNGGEETVNISGFVLKTESSAVDATIPENTFLPSEGYYLIADVGWNTSKDNELWPAADYEEAITLKNTDAGVALLDSEGNTLDAVGWGNEAEIDAGLFEGTPSNHTVSGESLQRDGDTNDNVQDFTAGNPTLQNSGFNAGEQATLILTVTITNSVPIIESFSILEDDSDEPGNQITPYPGMERIVPFELIVYDFDGEDDLVLARLEVNNAHISVEEFETLNETTRKYTGGFVMNYFDADGFYLIDVLVQDSANETAELSESFEYLSLIALEVDTQGINFPSKNPGSSVDVFGDDNISTSDKPTIKNIGNTMLDLGFVGENLTADEGAIAVENINYTVGGFTQPLTELLNVVEVDLEGSETTGLAMSLYIPHSTPRGAYQGGATVVAVGS